MRTVLLVAFSSLVSFACAKEPPASTTEVTSGPAGTAASSPAPVTSSAAPPAVAPKPAPVWPAATACDRKAFTALSHEIDTANGIHVDRSKPGAEAAIDGATRRITGKAVSLKGCGFAMQGNDLVWFAPAGMSGRAAVDEGIACKMKDGVAGVTAFRNAAMTASSDAMKLDVRGVVAVQDDSLKRLGLTECEIEVH